MLASADVAQTRSSRRRGVIGRADLDGAVVLQPCRWVHSLGMRFPLDVAYVDAQGTVVRAARLSPWRIGPLVRSSRFVIEAKAGSFERWGLAPGDTVEVRSS